jgi:hypothetical protein
LDSFVGFSVVLFEHLQVLYIHAEQSGIEVFMV